MSQLKNMPQSVQCKHDFIVLSFFGWDMASLSRPCSISSLLICAHTKVIRLGSDAPERASILPLLEMFKPEVEDPVAWLLDYTAEACGEIVGIQESGGARVSVNPFTNSRPKDCQKYPVVCDLSRIGSNFHDDKKKGVENAIQKHISRGFDMEAENTNMWVKKIECPPDGMCAFHALRGARFPEKYLSVTRNDNGYAVDHTIQKMEENQARTLREALLHFGKWELFVEGAESVLEASLADIQKEGTVDVSDFWWICEALSHRVRVTVEPATFNRLKQHVNKGEELYQDVIYMPSLDREGLPTLHL